jgi:hypothetical protein
MLPDPPHALAAFVACPAAARRRRSSIRPLRRPTLLKRACLLSVFVLASAAAVYYVVLSRYFEWPGNAIGAVLGSLFAAVFFGSLRGLLQASKDARLIRAAEAGEPFEDGRLVAAIGRIRPLGAPLEAPFSGTACLAYEYDVSHFRSGGSGKSAETREVHDAAGFALAPCRIDTKAGSVRLLGYAMLSDFPKSGLPAAEARTRARAYFDATPGSLIPRGRVFRFLDAMNEVLVDDDGAVRADWRMGEDLDLDGATLAERTVAVGAEVCALGIYAADRNGLVARGTTINRLVPGAAATASRSLLSDARTKAVAGTVFFLASHGMLGAMVYLSETRHAREPEDRQWSTLLSAAQSHDSAALERALRRGANPIARDASGKTVLFAVREADTVGVLLRLGADPNARDRQTGEGPLTMFARYGDLESVKLLVERGAVLNGRSLDGVTPLMAAIEADRVDVADYLRGKGAPEPIVTAGNGSPLPKDGGEPFAVCRKYLAAVQAGDAAALMRLSLDRRPRFFSGVDFEVWRNTRPSEPRFLGGYATATEATLAVGGAVGIASGVTWNYHLVRAPAGWKIAREWPRE